MKLIIRKQNPSAMKLELRPNCVILFVAGLLFIGAGLITIWALGYQTVFAVEEGNLRYEQKAIFPPGVSGFTYAADEVRGLPLVIQENSRSYEIIVEAGGNAHPTYLVSVGGDEKREIAARLLEALSIKGGAYRFEEDGRAGAILLGGVCMGGGLSCWFFMQVVTITADRERGTFMIHRRSRFLPRGKRRELKVDEIRAVRIADETMSTSKHRVVSYQVYLDLDDEEVPVAMGPMFTYGSAEALRDQLTAWLGLA
jgi:hypothetical protein